ncbi:exported hypothetical protein [Cupriavidus taiwanensis]|uniref:hypothetical protein n=1 Tax=Cupriavidus taiwanensis TaxID=164546 RepID=UPI000E1A6E66|nr:hypothetical protein [Cupriavidus taiwanensis]SPA23726.1 exported hypothetical protein [Cupriavidus taiwanensis]
MKNVKGIALCALVALTLTMSVRDNLPASEEEILRVVASVGGYPSAATALREGLMREPDPTKGRLRAMRAQALAQAKPAPAPGTFSETVKDRMAMISGLAACLLVVAGRILSRRLQGRRPRRPVVQKMQ